jgi:hypothetical protein
MSGVHFNLDRDHVKPRSIIPTGIPHTISGSNANMTPLGLMMTQHSAAEEEEYDDDSFDSYAHSKNSSRNSLEQPHSGRSTDSSGKTDKEEKEKKKCIVS